MAVEKRFQAIVLAGTRPGGDPFAQAMSVPFKAMVPVEGVALLRRVIDSLRQSESIDRIVICGMNESALRSTPQLAELLEDPRVALRQGSTTPATSTAEAIDHAGLSFPFLVTTGDHALLTSDMVDEFCRRAASRSEDVVVGAVDADIVRRRYPHVRRTFTPFRDGTFKGTNLFALMTPASRQAPLVWVRVEQERKHPWRMIRMLGPMVLIRFLLRQLTLGETIQRIADLMGVRIRVELLPFPEAALDVDSVDHLRVAEEILRQRERGAVRGDDLTSNKLAGAG